MVNLQLPDLPTCEEAWWQAFQRHVTWCRATIHSALTSASPTARQKRIQCLWWKDDRKRKEQGFEFFRRGDLVEEMVDVLADDRRLAAHIGATGLHLSETAIRRSWMTRLGASTLQTAAAHGEVALWRAERRGADAALLSPVFPTASHPGGRALGPWRFARLVRGAKLPVYALGGIDRRTVRRLAASGACGVAAIGALSPDLSELGAAAIRRAP